MILHMNALTDHSTLQKIVDVNSAVKASKSGTEPESGSVEC